MVVPEIIPPQPNVQITQIIYHPLLDPDGILWEISVKKEGFDEVANVFRTVGGAAYVVTCLEEVCGSDFWMSINLQRLLREAAELGPKYFIGVVTAALGTVVWEYEVKDINDFARLDL